MFYYRFALATHLLTPVLHPRDEADERFNVAHKRTRQCIERAFGVTKQRFRCLDKSGGDLTYAPEKCCKIVVACMILHNMCIAANVPMENDYDRPEDNNAPNEDVVNEIPRNAADNAVNHDAWQHRRQFIRQRFA